MFRSVNFVPWAIVVFIMEQLMLVNCAGKLEIIVEYSTTSAMAHSRPSRIISSIQPAFFRLQNKSQRPRIIYIKIDEHIKQIPGTNTILQNYLSTSFLVAYPVVHRLCDSALTTNLVISNWGFQYLFPGILKTVLSVIILLYYQVLMQLGSITLQPGL